MVAEFKKEAVLKEIGRLSGEIEEGQRIIEEAERIQQQQESMMSRLGLRPDDVSHTQSLKLQF